MKKIYSTLLILAIFSINILIGQNQFEPNDSFDDAPLIQLGEVNSAAIQVAGDEDYFKFEVITEGVIKVQIADIQSNYDVSLFNDDNSLSEIEFVTTPNFTSEATITEKTCTVGTHYLLIKDSPLFGTNFSDELYSFIVTLDTSDVYETNGCNDDFDSAAIIELDQIVEAAINDEFDEDFFKFEVPTEGVITVQVSNIQANYDISLYNDDNTFSEIEFVTTPNFSSEGTLIEKTCTPGTHYLSFKDSPLFGTEFSAELFSFIVTLDTSDVYETNGCNDDFDSAACIEFDQIIEAAINDELDEDYFKFEVPTEGVITVQVSNIQSNLEISLYNDDNSFSEIETVTTPNFSSEGTLIEKTCTPGTHYLSFKDSPLFGTEFSDQLFSFIVTLDTTDVYETNNCNDETNNAFQLPQICIDTIFAAINESGDQDYFQFTAPANTIINIEVKDIPSNIDMSIELTNGINTDSDQANNGNPVSVTLENQTESVYTLHLHDNGDSDFHESLFQVCIQVLPQIDLDIPNQDFCLDDAPFQLSGGSPIGGAYSGTGVDSTGNFDPSVAGVGQHEITYTFTDTSYSCSNQISQFVIVNELPNGSFTLVNDTVFVTDVAFNLQGGMPSGGEYTGVGVDSVSGEFDPSIAGIGTHEITYTVTNGFGCSNQFIDTITVVQMTSVMSLPSNMSINVSPNPFSETINIRVEQLTKSKIEFEIINLNGTILYTSPYQQIGDNFEVNLVDYPSGIYIVKFRIEGMTYSTKIIKE